MAKAARGFSFSGFCRLICNIEVVTDKTEVVRNLVGMLATPLNKVGDGMKYPKGEGMCGSQVVVTLKTTP